MDRIDRAAVIASGMITVNTDHKTVCTESYRMALNLEILDDDYRALPAKTAETNTKTPPAAKAADKKNKENVPTNEKVPA